jgi:hypothetical protein
LGNWNNIAKIAEVKFKKPSFSRQGFHKITHKGPASSADNLCSMHLCCILPDPFYGRREAGMIQEARAAKMALTPDTLWDIDYYKEKGLYFYLEATEELLPNGRVKVQNHGEMIMLGGYSYLGLIGHPQINAAAQGGGRKIWHGHLWRAPAGGNLAPAQ